MSLSNCRLTWDRLLQDLHRLGRRLPVLPGASWAADVVRRVESGAAKIVRQTESIVRDPGAAVKAVDQWAWHNIPSTVGYQIAGVDVDGVFSPLVLTGGVDLTVVFNWRSGEVGLLGGVGGQVGAGAGEKVSISWNGGPVASFGASSLEPLAGTDYEVGLSASVAPAINVGVTGEAGVSTDSFTQLTVDPVSNMHVTTIGFKVSKGAGAGADVSLTGGIPYMNYSWILGAIELW